jgi:hypothetical protein
MPRRKLTFDDVQVCSAHSACPNLDAHFARPERPQFTLFDRQPVAVHGSRFSQDGGRLHRAHQRAFGRRKTQSVQASGGRYLHRRKEKRVNAAVVNSFENPPHFGAFEDPVAETKEQLVSLRAAALTLNAGALRSSDVQLLGSGIGSVSIGRLVAIVGALLEAVVPAKLAVATAARSIESVATAWNEVGARRLVFTFPAA